MGVKENGAEEPVKRLEAELELSGSTLLWIWIFNEIGTSNGRLKGLKSKATKDTVTKPGSVAEEGRIDEPKPSIDGSGNNSVELSRLE